MTAQDLAVLVSNIGIGGAIAILLLFKFERKISGLSKDISQLQGKFETLLELLKEEAEKDSRIIDQLIELLQRRRRGK